MRDFVTYIDTDSLYIQLYQWFIDKGVDVDKWNNLEQKKQIKYIQRISKIIENSVNKKSLDETQKLHYNSQINDFSIIFEQEKIAFSGIFKTKKRYALWVLLNENNWKNGVSITGLEVIRSDSPEIVKPMIKRVLSLILLDKNDEEIRKYIRECKEKLKKCTPVDIAENKGINKTDKYLVNNYYKKGAPHQIKGVYYFKYMLELTDIGNKYEVPSNGNKAKVVYIKKNPYNVSSMSFLTWPKEFDKILQVDMEKMIENNFIKKIRDLLKIVNKEELINDQSDLF